MIKNEIELKPINSFGICKAFFTDKSITVRVYGVSGCLKMWLTGKNTTEVGNLVNGTITKEVDFSKYEGVLITQSGRQMFYGKLPFSGYGEKEKEKDSVLFDDNFTWKEITTKKFPSEDIFIRYILSHKCFYNTFLLRGRYYFGQDNGKMAVAVECNIKNEPHPFLHLSPYAVYKNGYMIVCVDTVKKSFYCYEY